VGFGEVMLTRRTLVQLTLALGVMAGLAGLSAFANWYIENTGWHESAWPFPRDAWPAGQAWRGEGGLEIYIRPKRGVRGDCEVDIAEDSEVDATTDIALLDQHFTPLQAGSRIRITDLFGRARLYRLKMKDGSERLAEAIAVAHDCDLVVAIVVGNVTDQATLKAAHQFIESNKVQVKLNKQLEGK
jgi:hypothetical protein